MGWRCGFGFGPHAIYTHYGFPQAPSHLSSYAHTLFTPFPICLLTTFLCRMGELEPWIDENFVRSVWFGMGEQVNVKMIRDKFSG